MSEEIKNIKIAQIVPLKFLELTKNNQYHMCLAHLVLKSDEYRDFYRRMSDEGKYVLVDNGAAEGEKMDYDDLMRVYELINPTEIILPDVLFDMTETISRTTDFVKNYDLDKYKKMIVPQGIDLNQWIDCCFEMLGIVNADTIGIPKWLGSKSETARAKICAMLSSVPQEVHLLGCSEGPIIVYCCRAINPRVRGCDSAFSYLCDKAGLKGMDAYTQRPKEKIEFLTDTITSNLTKLMIEFEELAGVTYNGIDETWRY